MIDIKEYILKPKQERQSHLKLDEVCIERGGHSTHLRGLLAHLLDTTIPKGMKIHICHACHNGACGNPNHIYWGTASDNMQDAIVNGKAPSPYHAAVRKYGKDKANEINRRSGFKRRSQHARNCAKKGGSLLKSKEHRDKISQTLLRKYADGELRGGRKHATNPEILVGLVQQNGLKGAADKLGITYEALKHRFYRLKRKI